MNDQATMSEDNNQLGSEIELRDVVEADLPILFEHQRQPEANEMAAYPASGWVSFMAHWAKIMRDQSTIKKAIIFRGDVAGNIVSYEQSGKRLVGYWLGKKFWGQGIASTALSQFLELVETRPLYSYVARRNVASIRVLEKCGFTELAETSRLLEPDGEEVAEFMYVLEK